jgi:hypothetical protein
MEVDFIMKNLSICSWIALGLFSSAATIGCGGDVPEEDELSTDTENVGSVAQALDLPDLIVESYTQTCVDDVVWRDVTIKNQGAGSVPAWGYLFHGYMVGCTNHPCNLSTWGAMNAVLAPGASRTVTASSGVSWTCASWDAMNGDWRFETDTFNYVAESDETNNITFFENTF